MMLTRLKKMLHVSIQDLVLVLNKLATQALYLDRLKSYKNITTESRPSMELKLIIQNVFKSLRRNNKLLLNPTKEGALNDFFTSYPTIITKTTTMWAIKSGFIYNGMVDNISYITPNMTVTLNTCKTKNVI